MYTQISMFPISSILSKARDLIWSRKDHGCEQAIKLIDYNLVLNPNSIELFSQKAYALDELYKYTDTVKHAELAIDLYKKVCSLAQDTPTEKNKKYYVNAINALQYLLNNLWFRYEDTDKEKTYLFQLIEVLTEGIHFFNKYSNNKIKVAELYKERGRAYWLLKDLEASVSDYTRCLEISPLEPYVLYDRAHVYFLMGNVECELADKELGNKLEEQGCLGHIH